ncbi:MAG: hypothetical protein PWQ55_1683 [Chloroflexota bacterium]|nr:hypothetical protein [Chloroflexota bacterium]
MIVNRDNLLKMLRSVYPFSRVEHEQLSILADKTEVVFFKAGEMVYLEGASARFLYVIFEGEVEVLREEHHGLVKKNHLYAGDLLGEDTLTRKQIRQTSVRALQDTLLVRISMPVLARFIQRNPDTRADFQFVASYYELLIKRSARLDFGPEAIYYIGQPHGLYLVVKTTLLLALALILGAGVIWLRSAQVISASLSYGLIGALALAFALWFWWNFMEWSNDIYIFTDRRVINQEQGVLLYEGREETPMDMIISLSSQASFLGRQYGFGDLFIKTFTGSLRLKNVPRVDQTRLYLDYLIEKSRQSKRREEKQNFAQYLDRRKGAGQAEEYRTADETRTGAAGQIHNTSFVQRLLGLKRARGETVTYRTHWLFLLRKTFLPFLLLAALALLWGYLWGSHARLIESNFFFGLLLTGLAFASLWWFYQYLDWRNDQYIITPDQLIDVYRKPLGREDRRAAPLENIQSIRYQRLGLPGLLFNYGTVFVKVGNEDFTFDNVYRPLEIQQTLFAYLERADLIEKRATLAEQQRQMLDWMDAYQQYAREHPEDEDGADNYDKSE